MNKLPYFGEEVTLTIHVKTTENEEFDLIFNKGKFYSKEWISSEDLIRAKNSIEESLGKMCLPSIAIDHEILKRKLDKV